MSDAQEALIELGYLKTSATGVFGEQTEQAVRAFQKRNGLTVDGKIGTKTRYLLYSPDAKEAPKPTPTPTKAPVKTPTPTPTKAPVKTPTPTPTKAPTKTTTPAKTTAPVKTVVPTPTVAPTPNATAVEKAIALAESLLGKKYVRGAEGPNSFDCSGLVCYALRATGLSVGRLNAAGYYTVSKWTFISSISKLKKGDLLFFRTSGTSRISHTGIYIGNGMMIDASSSNGQVVKRSCTTPYWTRAFAGARRPFV